MSACQITLYKTPMPLALDDLDGSLLDVFFATGILNPFGPTLSVVGAVGEPRVGREIPVVEIMLNPFTQEVTQIGKMMVGEQWSPLRDLAPLIEREYGGCPTIVLVSNQVPESVRFTLVTQILESYGERVKDVSEAVRKHFGDPWTRVTQEIRGVETQSCEQTGAEAAEELASLILSSKHLKPELQGFFYAWHGSIENTGISEGMKRSAMNREKFQTFFFERIIPSVWVPNIEPDEDAPPPVKRLERFDFNSLEDILSILKSGQWQSFSEEQLVSLLRAVLFVYGHQGDTEYIKYVSGVYHQLLKIGADEDTRLMLESEMISLVEHDKVLTVVFLPFLVEDPSPQVVSKAVIDFVSMSDYVDGELYAFTELRHFFKQGNLANPGAVLGGLVATGDRQSIKLAIELRGELNPEEIRIAANVTTPFPQHRMIQFWLQWAKELVTSQVAEDQKNFGSAASALVLAINPASRQQVTEGDRNYPCHKSEPPVIHTRTWTREEYAEEIAEDLYWVESQEGAPRLFSVVLRHWGLMPQAPVDEQFMDERPSENKPLKDLGPKPPVKDGEGFLSRLFGTKQRT